MSEFGKQFWTVVCRFQLVWQLIFALTVVLLVMLVGASVFVDPGSASYVVTVLGFIVGIPLAIASGYFTRKCGRAVE